MARKKTEINEKNPFMEEVMRTLPVMCYAEIADIDPEHGVVLVQHIESGKIAVRKKCRPDRRKIYEYLMHSPLPGIPRIFALCEENEELVVVEEYISGISLRDYLSRRGPMTARTAAFCTAQLAAIAERLHKADPPIVHRDIKPENVIISDDGRLFLVDFGAARFAAAGKKRDTKLLGTPGYAAPEQYGFGPSGPAADVYALGMLFYELAGANTGKLSRMRIGAVMRRATSAMPANRYRNAGDLKRAIFTCLSPGEVWAVIAENYCWTYSNRRIKRKEKKNGLCGDVLLRGSGSL